MKSFSHKASEFQQFLMSSVTVMY